MAKDADGNIIPEYQDPMAGYEDGEWNIFNPLTGEYETKAQTEDPFKYNPRGDETNWVFDSQGKKILMDTTGEDWQSKGSYNPELEGWQLGYDAPAYESPTYKEGDLALGPGSVIGDPSGGGGGTAPPPTAPPPPVGGGGGGDMPTNDWPVYDDPPGYENVPPPKGDGDFRKWHGEQNQADTSWDWDAFRMKAPGDRQWGGYDKDYQAFERYQPGMESPWGMPNIEGGNRDFYQQQFANLLRDDQGYRNRSRSAQGDYQEAQNNPIEAPPIDWSWANQGKGLTPVETMQSGYASPMPGQGMDAETFGYQDSAVAPGSGYRFNLGNY